MIITNYRAARILFPFPRQDEIMQEQQQQQQQQRETVERILLQLNVSLHDELVAIHGADRQLLWMSCV